MQGVQEEIIGQTVIMRPYLRQFVEKYHSWMVCSPRPSQFLPSPAPVLITKSMMKDDMRRRIPFFVNSPLQSSSH